MTARTGATLRRCGRTAGTIGIARHIGVGRLTNTRAADP